ncbi:putative glycosyl transferase [Planctomycetes bacterium Pla163]|uniref:Putative glycosyl transferase n=1 Tax=Rohdeia mirabilis TaxID=2528008 RepID=A0A518CYN7_9BACT|nr:putative glycosyl transferase [Planctomycetes bacterium Pla163]
MSAEERAAGKAAVPDPRLAPAARVATEHAAKGAAAGVAPNRFAHLFPPLADPGALPRRVLVIAPHADDEVLGCGGMLAFHTQRGDSVRVVVLTDGALGDRDGLAGDDADALGRTRQEESVAAGRILGVSDHRFCGLEDGGLGTLADLSSRIADEIADFDPDLVYGPSPHEFHTDHRATAAALITAAAADTRTRTYHLFGVNTYAHATVLYDTTAFWTRKSEALAAFASQMAYHDLVEKCGAFDRSRTVNVPDDAVQKAEGYVSLPSERMAAYGRAVATLVREVADAALIGGEGAREPAATRRADARRAAELGVPRTTAVISTWNKVLDVVANVESLLDQTLAFAEIVVVDNCSSDGTAELLAERFPEVRVIRTPHDKYGACETFNIGFASVTTPWLAILDDDVVLPPDWLEKASVRLLAEPDTTALLSSKVVEPGMPASYTNSERVNTERYMSTFRGCGSLAKVAPLRAAGWYDERLFIYGNERDLTCRLLADGYRVLQYPGVVTYHSTPFGLQMGKRSLYYHARNAWLTQLKYAPFADLVKLPWLVLTKVLLRSETKETGGEVTDAVGTIGIGSSIKNTKGAWRVLAKAAWSILLNVPYCLRHRRPVHAPDFRLPIE